MRVPTFEVRDQRSIRFAKCEKVPTLMIVAGPNGAGKSHFYPPSTGNIATSAADFLREVSERYQPKEIERFADLAVQKVNELASASRRREEFHGKAVMQAFYGSHIHKTGIPKVVFAFETARHARRRRSVVAFFDAFFADLARSGE